MLACLHALGKMEQWVKCRILESDRIVWISPPLLPGHLPLGKLLKLQVGPCERGWWNHSPLALWGSSDPLWTLWNSVRVSVVVLMTGGLYWHLLDEGLGSQVSVKEQARPAALRVASQATRPLVSSRHLWRWKETLHVWTQSIFCPVSLYAGESSKAFSVQIEVGMYFCVCFGTLPRIVHHLGKSRHQHGDHL